MSLLGIRRRRSLTDVLSAQRGEDRPVGRPRPTASTRSGIVRLLRRVDERYQQLVKEHVDPLFRAVRQQQMQTFAQPQQKEARELEVNRNLGLGLGAMGSAIVGHFLFPPLNLLSIGLGCTVLVSLAKEGIEEAKRSRRPRAIHLITAYSTFMWLGGYYFIGALAFGLLGVRQKLMLITEDRAHDALVGAFGQQPRSAWVLVDGVETEVAFEQIQVGDTIVLHAGETVPVDGIVVDGAAQIDQQMLTGESQPVEKELGDPVLASTLVLAGKVFVRVEKAGTETTAAQIGEMLRSTSRYQIGTLSKISENAERLVLPSMIWSALCLPLVGVSGAFAMLGANFTVGMVGLGPVTMLGFLNQASHRGILIKDGRAMEQLGRVDTVVFDKTGTLTLEQPTVAHIHTVPGVDEADVLGLAAAAEHRQSHPIARAILAAARERKLELPPLQEARYQVGYGLRVSLPGKVVHVGSRRYMEMEAIDVPESLLAGAEEAEEKGHSTVFVSVDGSVDGGVNGGIVGAVELRPTLRPEAKQIVQALTDRGLALHIISGDREGPTRRLAAELGIASYHASTLPEDKARLIAQLQESGHTVCFVGDGINDAVAMRTADTSVSLRGATTAATDTAHIVLMDGSLAELDHAFALAQRFQSNVQTNFNIATGSSILCMSAILFGGLSFVATETLFQLYMLTGLGIASKPMLDASEEEREA